MLRPGHCIALLALALLCLGVIMVSSAEISLSKHRAVTFESIVTSRSALYMGLAMFAMLMTSMLPVRALLVRLTRLDPALRSPLHEPSTEVAGRVLSLSWLRFTARELLRLWPVWLAGAALLAIIALSYVPGIASPKFGAHRWISLGLPGFDSLQPSEFAKWGVVLVIAWYGARSARRIGSFWIGLVPGLAVAGLVAGAVVIEDLGTGVLMAAAAGVVLLGAGAKFWHFLVLCPVPICGAIVAIVTSPYRINRIHAFMDPYVDPKETGFHMIQSMVAIANGQVFGRGLGNGLQKFDYLPMDTSDFLFAIICEELGVMGAMLVMSLIAGLVWSIWFIVRSEREPMFRLIGLGVMATLAIQALINIAVVTGLGPTKGIALPLVSHGGTGWVLTCAVLGLLIAVDRTAAQPERSARVSAQDEASQDQADDPLRGTHASLPASGLIEDKPRPAEHAGRTSVAHVRST
jgi:cell division protein FtsW